MNQTPEFAAILKQVAQEMNLEVFNPDDPERIYAEFPQTDSWEDLDLYHQWAGARLRYLCAKAESEEHAQ